MSSLYNLTMGRCHFSAQMLAMVMIDIDKVARFRDVWIDKSHGDLRLGVLARIGGGNREDYQENIDDLCINRYFIEESDEAQDETYMSLNKI